MRPRVKFFFGELQPPKRSLRLPFDHHGPVSALGNQAADPLWCHEDGTNFIRGNIFKVRCRPQKPSNSTLSLIRSAWRQVEPISVTAPVWDGRHYDIDLSDKYGAHLTHTLTNNEWQAVDQSTGHALSQVAGYFPRLPTPIHEEQHKHGKSCRSPYHLVPRAWK